MSGELDPVPWRLADTVLIILVALAGAGIGTWLVFETGRVFFYQNFMPSSIVAACGRGWFEPAIMPPALLQFAIAAMPHFDCAVLDGVPLQAGLGQMARGHIYLAATASALWRLLGLDVTSLWPLAAGLSALFTSAGYALGRLFFPRLAALAIGLLLAVSPLANSVLEFSLRDYAKAGFLIWGLVLAIWALRAQGGRALVLLALTFGAVVGIGAGFRGDVSVMVPIGLIIFTLGQWRGPVSLCASAAAAGVFLVTAMALMTPMRANGEGFLGGAWMQGLSEPFRYRLRLAPALYDLGERYSDELTYSAIAADLRRPDPADYDAREDRPLAGSQSQYLATSYALGWAPAFAADIATRALAAAWLAAGLPTLLDPATPRVQLYDVVYPGRFSLARAMTMPMSLIASRWTPAVGVAGLLLLLLRVYARARREAFWLAVMLLLLLGLPSLQFAVRHLFHLEAVFWLAMLGLLTAWQARHSLVRHLPGFAAWCIGFFVIGAAVYGGLVLAQQRILRARIDALLEAPATAVDPAVQPRPGERLLLEVPVPPQYRDLLDGPYDSLVSSLVSPSRGLRTARAAADRLLIDIGGPNCDTPSVALRLSYTLKPATWQSMQRDILVPRPSAGWDHHARVVVPAFYRASQHFEGLEIAAADRACIGAVWRLDDDRRLPIVFSAVLQPGWEEQALRLRLHGALGPPPPR